MNLKLPACVVAQGDLDDGIGLPLNLIVGDGDVGILVTQ